MEFGDGFTALTGETGAGKSLIVDALGLLLGERASADGIAAGAERAEIQAAFDVAPGHPAHEWLAERDLAAEGECLLRRTVSRKSASRAFVNGVAVAVQDLKTLGALLVDVHGQHEHQHLLSRERQRQTLDAFAGIEPDVRALADTFAHWMEALDRLERMKNRGAAERERARLLEFQVAELEALELVPGEADTLPADHHRLAHAQELMEGVAGVLDALAESDDSISERLGRAGHTIDVLVRHDGALDAVARQIETVTIEVSELASDLRQRLSSYEFDPAELDRLQRRLDQLHGISRKYHVGMDELPALLETCSRELSDVAADDDAVAAVEAEVAERAADYERRAATVTKRRQTAAQALGKDVIAQLADLGMAGARFEVTLSRREEPRPSGMERVEFQISANPGQPAGPLSKVASGGELSRVALAINMVSNRATVAVTQVYDEVDVGIGGRVAEMVGQKLRAVAADRQVLCVTHLPQVASQAVRQLRVRKSGEKSARVSVEPLDEKARLDEIARMLGGIEITERTVEHAGEMLEKARK